MQRALLSFVLGASLAGSVAHAETPSSSLDAAAVADQLAADAAWSPLLLHAGGVGRGFAVGSTSYRTTTEQATVDVAGEVHLWGRLGLVLRVDDAISDSARPGIGAALRLLDERHHGVDLTGYLLYKAEGFTEPEGELEAAAAVAHSFGAVRAVANVAYGQDPEGNERDGELGAGLLVHPMAALTAGAVARYRDALGSRGEAGVVRDLFAGASVSYVVGRIGVTGLAGLDAIETSAESTFDTGFRGTVAVGSAF